MRGTTETMGTMLRLEYDEDSAQFLQRAVEHPFTAGQDVQTDAEDPTTVRLLIGTDAPPTSSQAPPTPETTKPSAIQTDDPIEGLRIVA